MADTTHLSLIERSDDRVRDINTPRQSPLRGCSSLRSFPRYANVDLSLAIRHAEPAFSFRRWKLRNSFVGIQMALAVVLLALGVFFTRGFLRMSAAERGFDTAHTLFAGVQPVRGVHAGEEYFTWRGEPLRAVRAVPGVAAASSTTIIPLSAELRRFALRLEGEPPSAAREAYRTGVGDQYFTTFATPMLRGRDFELRDRTRRPVPAVINRALARELFGADDPAVLFLLLASGAAAAYLPARRAAKLDPSIALREG